MPLQATSGAASYDAFGGGVPVVPNYIEDVFLTYLYAGNGAASRTITTNFDLSTKGGLVWLKNRTSAYSHMLVDTVRGIGLPLSSDTTAAQASFATGLSSVSTTGFTTNATANYFGQNTTSTNIVTWSFVKQPKFFDIVTYTGNGTTQNIAHSLGSTPGCVMVKRTDTTGAWIVWHRGLSAGNYIVLNDTGAQSSSGAATAFGNNTTYVDPTSTVFTVGNATAMNASGGTYVAYIYAHNAGGFGLTGTDNVISCGTFSGNTTVNLGYEPQWLLMKSSSGVDNWYLLDTMRGWVNNGSTGIDAYLQANSSTTETANGTLGVVNSTGFTTFGFGGGTGIYIAIRKGPMKVPTDATKVFSPNLSASTSGTAVTTGFPLDLQIANYRAGLTPNFGFSDRLRGISTTSTTYGNYITSTSNTAETVSTTEFRTLNVGNTGYSQDGYLAGSGTGVYWTFRRAPKFFDEVCYTGTGSATTITHNLTVTPELIIVKQRNTTRNWVSGNATNSWSNYIVLNAGNATAADSTIWNATNPTSSVFSVGTSVATNQSAGTYVAYLFATCAGVSKVGSYTGNGSTQTIDCGFGAGGVRFVLIKRTDSTGDWYVYDTARGMTVLTDPYLLLNSTAAETATLGSVTTVSTGFAVNASILAAINTNAASYIFLAIA